MEVKTTPPDSKSKSESMTLPGAQDFNKGGGDKPSGGGTKLKKFLTLGLISAAACGTVFYFLNHNKSGGESSQSAPEAVITVTTAKVATQTLESLVKVNGTVWAWDPLTIGSEVNGLKVEEINVDDGDVVKKGQVLARLNSSVLNAQLAEEKAKLAAQKANLRKAIQPNRPEDLLSLKAALAQTESAVAEAETMLSKTHASLINAQNNAKRYRGLVAEGAVSEQDAEQRETESKTTEAEMRNAEQKVKTSKFQREQAKQRLVMGEQGGRQEDVEISRASLAQNEANVRRLEALVAQAVIKAPSDGMIMRREVHLGEITAVNKTLFSMVRDNRLEMRAQVAEVDLPFIRDGQKVTISDTTNSSFALTGKVREVSPMVDQDLRLGMVRIDLPRFHPGTNQSFKPGNFVHAQIDTGTKKALAVPIMSVLSKEHKNFVYKVNDDNTVAFTPVKTGARQNGWAEVLSGLKEGDTIVVRGAGFLKNGDLVRVSQEVQK